MPEVFVSVVLVEAPEAPQVFLPVGAEYVPFAFERQEFVVQPERTMGFGSASASKTYTPAGGK